MNNTSFNNDIQVEFSLALPYIYVPNTQWAEIAEAIDSASDYVDCSWSGNYCRFYKGCQDVSKSEMLLTIELEGYDLQIDLMDMLVDGGSFGMATGRYCYLPIFKSL